MKTTGVSRRIDDLGRIVIPKEIRKNLKIRNGEMLEIMVDEDNIILSKHSTMRGIAEISKLLAGIFGDLYSMNILITDRDKVIATSAEIKKKFEDISLSSDVIDKITTYQPVIERERTVLKFANESSEDSPYIIYPIIIDGDILGSVIILGKNDKLDQNEEKTAEVISKILSYNMM